MTELLFQKWIEQDFLPRTAHLREDGKKVALIVDGHASHCGLETSVRCREEGVVLLGLPAHRTQLLQPFDVGVAGALKAHYEGAKARWRATLREDQSHNISKKQMMHLLAFPQGDASVSAWEATVCERVVRSAFRKTGICPLHRNCQSVKERFSGNKGVVDDVYSQLSEGAKEVVRIAEPVSSSDKVKQHMKATKGPIDKTYAYFLTAQETMEKQIQYKRERQAKEEAQKAKRMERERKRAENQTRKDGRQQTHPVRGLKRKAEQEGHISNEEEDTETEGSFQEEEKENSPLAQHVRSRAKGKRPLSTGELESEDLKGDELTALTNVQSSTRGKALKVG